MLLALAPLMWNVCKMVSHRWPINGNSTQKLDSSFFHIHVSAQSFPPTQQRNVTYNRNLCGDWEGRSVNGSLSITGLQLKVYQAFTTLSVNWNQYFKMSCLFPVVAAPDREVDIVRKAESNWYLQKPRFLFHSRNSRTVGHVVRLYCFGGHTVKMKNHQILFHLETPFVQTLYLRLPHFISTPSKARRAIWSLLGFLPMTI